jgi:hypothetical protein
MVVVSAEPEYANPSSTQNQYSGEQFGTFSDEPDTSKADDQSNNTTALRRESIHAQKPHKKLARLNIATNTTSIQTNDTVRFTVSRTDIGQPTNATIAINGSRWMSGDDGIINHTFHRPKTATVKAVKNDSQTTVFANDSVNITVQRSFVDLNLVTNQSQAQLGNPLRLSVVKEGTSERVNAMVEINGSKKHTGSDGTITHNFQTPGEHSIIAHRVVNKDTLALRDTATVTVTGCTAQIIANITGKADTIQLNDIQSAIQFWKHDEPVPNTNETLGLRDVQNLIDLWASDQPVDCGDKSIDPNVVVGSITNETGGPISEALVTNGDNLGVWTDTAGRYTIPIGTDTQTELRVLAEGHQQERAQVKIGKGGRTVESFNFGSQIPNLKLIDLQWKPHNPTEGAPIKVSAVVQNVGPSVSDIKLNATIGDKKYFVSGINFDSNETKQITITRDWNAQGGPGNNVIVAQINPDNTPQEFIRDDNRLTAAVQVDELDLSVTDIEWKPRNPSPNDSVQFTATIRNRGIVSAQKVTTKLTVDGNVLDTTDVDVPAGRLRRVQFDATWPASGDTTQIAVEADPQDQIAESDETNNEWSSVLLVHKPELAIRHVGLTQFNPVVGDTVSFTGIIENTGRAAANNVDVELHIGDEQITATGLDIDPRDQDRIEFEGTWTATAGRSQITAVVDPNDEIPEEQEGNNQFSRLIAVDRGTGVLQGEVKNLTGVPIENALVRLSSGRTAVTESDGSYTFESVPAGDHEITIEKDGYRTIRDSAVVRTGDTTFEETPLVKKPDPDDPDDPEGPAKSTLTVTVSDDDKDAIEDAIVRLQGASERRKIVGVSGESIFNELPAGSYSVSVNHLGYEQTESITIGNGENRNLEFEIRDSARFAGEVVTSEGKPVPEATVVIEGRQAETSPSGRFEFDETFEAGRYPVQILYNGELVRETVVSLSVTEDTYKLRLPTQDKAIKRFIKTVAKRYAESKRDTASGAIFGEFGLANANAKWLFGADTQSISYLYGWLGASVVPVIDAPADIRDCLVRHEETPLWTGVDCTGAVVSTLGSLGSVVGVGVGVDLAEDVTDFASVLYKWLRHVPPSKASEAGEKAGEILRKLPGEVRDKVLKRIEDSGLSNDKVRSLKLSAKTTKSDLKTAGYSDSQIGKLEKGEYEHAEELVKGVEKSKQLTTAQTIRLVDEGASLKQVYRLINAGSEPTSIIKFVKSNNINKDLREIEYVVSFGKSRKGFKTDVAYLPKWRWHRHIIPKHITGKEYSSSLTKPVDYWPTGEFISARKARGPRALPDTMNRDKVFELIEEAAKKMDKTPPVKDDPSRIVYHPNKYGISKMRIIVNKNTGEIRTAFPETGAAVRRVTPKGKWLKWDSNKNKWVLWVPEKKVLDSSPIRNKQGAKLNAYA